VAISFAAHKGDCFVVAILAMTDPAKRTSILATAIMSGSLTGAFLHNDPFAPRQELRSLLAE
jgi:hypothetical protein